VFNAPEVAADAVRDASTGFVEAPVPSRTTTVDRVPNEGLSDAPPAVPVAVVDDAAVTPLTTLAEPESDAVAVSEPSTGFVEAAPADRDAVVDREPSAESTTVPEALRVAVVVLVASADSV
jgi:hypothetical protein